MADADDVAIYKIAFSLEQTAKQINMITMQRTTQILGLALVLCAVFFVTTYASFTIEYSEDDGATWTTAGQLASNLKSLAPSSSSSQSTDFIAIRPGHQVRIGTAISRATTCAPMTASSSLGYSAAGRLAIWTNAAKDNVVAFSYCTVPSDKQKTAATKSGKPVLPVLVTKSPEAAVRSAMQTPGDIVPFGALERDPNVAATKKAQPGQAQEEEQNQPFLWGFIKRWWYVIIPLVLMLIINMLSASMGEMPAQEGGASDAGAAPK